LHLPGGSFDTDDAFLLPYVKIGTCRLYGENQARFVPEIAVAYQSSG